MLVWNNAQQTYLFGVNHSFFWWLWAQILGSHVFLSHQTIKLGFLWLHLKLQNIKTMLCFMHRLELCFKLGFDSLVFVERED